MILQTHKHWIDLSAVTGFVVAGASLANMALIVTILAGIASISLAALRWYVWFKYGEAGDDD